jgi:hypothetical protein
VESRGCLLPELEGVVLHRVAPSERWYSDLAHNDAREAVGVKVQDGLESDHSRLLG